MEKLSRVEEEERGNGSDGAGDVREVPLEVLAAQGKGVASQDAMGQLGVRGTPGHQQGNASVCLSSPSSVVVNICVGEGWDTPRSL
ncbi:hypothetical protein E2C01_046322 [Portunus trituberculatus]|uniref:Uncharacterized protein n=1 Tax=Portunus trituberculatus TaxID=210409 RepID=A0A5B7G0M8_PORTR|nr:hypothetical protein [Portunus trituberculatus]